MCLIHYFKICLALKKCERHEINNLLFWYILLNSDWLNCYVVKGRSCLILRRLCKHKTNYGFIQQVLFWEIHSFYTISNSIMWKKLEDDQNFQWTWQQLLNKAVYINYNNNEIATTYNFPLLSIKQGMLKKQSSKKKRSKIKGVNLGMKLQH